MEQIITLKSDVILRERKRTSHYIIVRNSQNLDKDIRKCLEEIPVSIMSILKAFHIPSLQRYLTNYPSRLCKLIRKVVKEDSNLVFGVLQIDFITEGEYVLIVDERWVFFHPAFSNDKDPEYLGEIHFLSDILKLKIPPLTYNLKSCSFIDATNNTEI
jgi:hypothetical protein